MAVGRAPGLSGPGLHGDWTDSNHRQRQRSTPLFTRPVGMEGESKPRAHYADQQRSVAELQRAAVW